MDTAHESTLESKCAIVSPLKNVKMVLPAKMKSLTYQMLSTEQIAMQCLTQRQVEEAISNFN